MYANGMSQRDISDTIEDIYGFKVSHEMISQITDAVLEEFVNVNIKCHKNCIKKALIPKLRNQDFYF